MRAMTYSIVRLVPDPVSNEALNLGVILHDVERQTAVCQFAEKLERLDLLTDFKQSTELLQIAIDDLEASVQASGADPLLLETKAAELQHLIQLMGPFTTLGENAGDELDDIFGRFVTLDSRRIREPSGLVTRRQVVSLVSKALQVEQAAFSKNVKVPGKTDSFKFDFAVRNGSMHFVQCLTLAIDPRSAVDQAKVMAFSAADILENPDTRAQWGEPKFNAVLAPPVRDRDRLTSAIAVLEGSSISVTRLDLGLADFARTLGHRRPPADQ